MGQCVPKLKRLIVEFLHIALSILTVLVIYPIFIPLCILLSIYRQFVNLLAKLTDPKITCMVSGLDAFLTQNNPYSKPVSTLLVLTISLEEIQYQQVVNTLKNLLNVQQRFTRSKEKLVQKFGYMFWQKTDNFRVEDHIRHLNEQNPDEAINRQDIYEICQERLMRLPFLEDHPLWEFILVKNFIDKNDPRVKSLSILRINHCIGDGYHLLSFCKSCSKNGWELADSPFKTFMEVQASNDTRTNMWSTVKSYALYFLATVIIPYFIIKQFSVDFSNAARSIFNPMLSTKTVYFQVTPTLSLKRLKNIKNRLGVSIPSVLLAVCVRSIGELKTKRKGENVTEQTVSFILPIPRPRKSLELTNHVISGKAEVKMKRNESILTTVYSVDKSIKEMKNPLQVLALSTYYDILGILPTSSFPEWKKYIKLNLGFSVLAGPTSSSPAKKLDLWGYPFEEIVFVTDSAIDIADFIVTGMSVNQRVKLTWKGLESALPEGQKDVNLLCKIFMEKLAELEDSVMGKQSEDLVV